LNDLAALTIDNVFARGKLVASDGQLQVDLPKTTYPEWATNSVHIPQKLTAADFRLSAPEQKTKAVAHVIGIIENQAPTRHLTMEVPITHGEVLTDPERDLAKVAVVERHRSTGRITLGLVHGFGLRDACAVATTMAHDSHQMIIVGTDEGNMAAAANALAAFGGGQVVVLRGEVIGKVELPIAGIISSERADIVAAKASTVLDGFKACGCRLNNPNMQLSLLGLVVIPELRISDLGLVDTSRFTFIPVIE